MRISECQAGRCFDRNLPISQDTAFLQGRQKRSPADSGGKLIFQCGRQLQFRKRHILPVKFQHHRSLRLQVLTGIEQHQGFCTLQLFPVRSQLHTPFKEDDSVDYDALLRLVDYQLQNGTDFLCVLGTTAETPTLTKEEKDKIKRLIIERVNGRIPILLGVSSNCTRAVVETLKNDDMTGVDAVLVAVPYYNKPSQEGIYQHYKAIAEATDLPVVLYNVPGRTGVNMTAETTLRLARDFKNIIAIKEASGNITQMDDIIKNKPANFDVISGDDGITFPLITLGAVGVISVIGNAFPREFSRMTRLALQGDFANALTIHHKFTELFSLLFVDGNPAGVKAMLNVMGLIENKLRLPLVPTRITTFEKMRAILNELKIKC